MNLKQAKIILEKINTLYKNMSIDESVSAIEKDLMLAYIRQLYESFLEQNTISVKQETAFITPPRTTTPPPSPKIEEEEVVVAKEMPKEEPIVHKKPIVIEIPDSLKKYSTPKTKVVEASPVVEVKPVEPKPAPKAAPKPKEVAPTSSQKKANPLFEMPEGKELSDKLASAPIKDLTKAMGLNEKILTINELFGGDHRVFDDTIKHINKLDSFDDAKNFLAEHIAEQFNWNQKGKKKKAQIFIRLIKRRFS